MVLVKFPFQPGLCLLHWNRARGGPRTRVSLTTSSRVPFKWAASRAGFLSVFPLHCWFSAASSKGGASFPTCFQSSCVIMQTQARGACPGLGSSPTFLHSSRLSCPWPWASVFSPPSVLLPVVPVLSLQVFCLRWLLSQAGSVQLLLLWWPRVPCQPPSPYPSLMGFWRTPRSCCCPGAPADPAAGRGGCSLSHCPAVPSDLSPHRMWLLPSP